MLRGNTAGLGRTPSVIWPGRMRSLVDQTQAVGPRVRQAMQRARALPAKVWVYVTVLVIAAILALSLLPLSRGVRLPKDAGLDPESGQWVLKDELILLMSGQDQLAIEFGGEITFAAPEAEFVQVRFPVSSLAELGGIQLELEERGVEAIKEIPWPMPSPGGPE
jgi:hypothetical protein